MSDGSHVIRVCLATGEDPEWWHDRIANLCRCRRHWWQFWRSRSCGFAAISSQWEPFEDGDT